MKKKLLAMMLTCVMAVSLAACAGGDESAAEDAGAAGEAAEEDAGEDAAEAEGETEGEAQEEGGVLVMATNAEFPPYEYYEGGEVVGIDAEIAAAIAEKLGMTREIEDMAFDSIVTSVSTGKADMGVAGMTVTEARLQNVNFSEPYATATQVVILREDSDIQDVAGLEGKTVGVQLGTTGDLFAEDIKDVTVERYNKGFEAVQALSQEKIDAVIIDQEPAKVFVEENEGLIILDEAYTVEEYAIAIAKDNTELLEQVNAALAELKESGKLDEIIGKYITAE